jgi:hypothetical protein
MVTLLTHNSCGSSCIMARGQMKGIHLFLYSFWTVWPWITLLQDWDYTWEALGRKTYHHRDNDINNTQFMWLLLYHGSWTNERDPSMFYTLSEQFDHELHLTWVGPPNKKCHDNEANINTRTMTLLAHNSCGSSCIMARVKMKGIRLFFIIFMNSLTMKYI